MVRNKTKSRKNKKAIAASPQWSIRGKTVLITGGNTGIGKATAMELARQGAKKIIIACRNVEQGEEAAQQMRLVAPSPKNFRVVVRRLDLSSLQSVRQFAKEINATEKALHVLINNAGILAPSTRTLTAEGNEMTFATNHLGHFLLTKLLLTLLKKSGPSRIISLTTHWFILWLCRPGFHIDDVNYERTSYSSLAYNQSKLANVYFVKELHERLQEEGATNVTTYCVHPGIVASDITRDFNFICRLLFPFFVMGPDGGAKTSIYCATEPGIEHLSSGYFANCKNVDPGYITHDASIAERLWQLSEELVAKAP